MSYTSFNAANNITVAEAQAFVDKMRGLGLPFGELHVDENEGGGSEGTSIVAISDLPEGELEEGEKYYIKAFCIKDFHGIADLKRRMQTAIEPIMGFDHVCDEIGVDTETAMLKIPSVNKAIIKALQA